MLALRQFPTPSPFVNLSPSHSFSSNRSHCLLGFSLMELLAAIAIISILAVASQPALSGIMGSRNLSRAAGDVASCLEFARSEAIAKNTFVWVGFTNLSQNGTSNLALSIVASRDGSPTSSAANLAPLQRNLRFENIRLATDAEASACGSPLRSLTSDAAGQSAVLNPMSRGGRTSADFTAAQMTFGNTITFTPQGEALLTGNPTSSTPLDPFVGVYLQKMRGDSGSADLAPLLINGASGQVRLIAQQ